MNRIAALAVFAVMAAPTGALACTPPPPPPPGTTPEQAQAMARDRAVRAQASLWVSATSVYLASIEDVESVKVTPQVDGRAVALRHRLSLKGRRPARTTSVRHTGVLCGLHPDFDVFDGSVGDLFVVYAGDDGVMGTQAVAGLLDHHALDAWRAAAR